MIKIKVSSPSPNVSGFATLWAVTNKIVSLELLQGDEVVSDAEVEQFVNLKRDKKHVDGSIVKHIDRLGRALRLKVTFEKESNIKFKVELKGTINYFDSETKRNPNFTATKSKDYRKVDLPNSLNNASSSTEKGKVAYIDINSGEKSKDNILVSTAGCDIFTITATDEFGNTVTAKTKVKTQRLLYYVEAKMEKLTNIAPNLNEFLKEYRKHGIIFKKLPPVKVGHIDNIGSDEERLRLERDIKAVTKSIDASKKPDYLVIGYVDQMAIKGFKKEIKPFAVSGKEVGDIKIPIEDKNNEKDLWYGIGDGNWYVDCYFIDGQSGAKKKIPKEKCIPSQSNKSLPAGSCDQVTIKADAIPKKPGIIKLIVNWVDKMRGGSSPTGNNIVLVATRVWWTGIAFLEQNEVVIHEVGHKLGMVSNGANKLPAKHAFHYTGKGHNGNHCHFGLPSASDYKNVRNSRCVMFGQTNGKREFCSECAKNVKKIDLTEGIR